MTKNCNCITQSWGGVFAMIVKYFWHLFNFQNKNLGQNLIFPLFSNKDSLFFRPILEEKVPKLWIIRQEKNE